jgi:HSP20 family protein
LFENFDVGFWRTEPFLQSELSWGTVLPVDVVEKDQAYEITAELPGLDEKDVEVEHSNSMLTIKGEKKEESEEKKQGFYVSERSYAPSSGYSASPRASTPIRLRRRSRKVF